MSRNTIQYDLKAGFSVFLLALPLCLGIAVASNFPPIAGIITAIVGGIISTFLGSSRLTIKGPAAGLIVIALGAVNELGGGDLSLGYKRAIAAGAIAAVIQILFAAFRMAKVAEIMPPSVIHGMLAAIGVIIIAKQSHVVLGVKPESSGAIPLLAELPQNLLKLNPEIFVIGLLSFLIVILLPKIKAINFIPASIVVLLVAIPLSYAFDLSHPHNYSVFGLNYELGPKYLVNLPGQIFSGLTFPDFSQIFSITSIKYIVMFALVGSIESLLTVCAVDSLDPEKKQSDLNKDLFSTGAGNLIASLLGGLPMISEIVRSKANIDYGAKSKYSNFFHGMFLLISIALLPWLLGQIPLSALAALLVYTGFRLASPLEFKKTFHIGIDQFLLFSTTLIVTLLTDLLVGVACGIILKILLHLIRGARLKDFFVLDYKKAQNNSVTTIKIEGALVFSNFLKLKKIIEDEVNNGQNIILDLHAARMIDHTIQEKLDSMKEYYSFTMIGFENLKATSEHHHSFKRMISRE